MALPPIRQLRGVIITHLHLDHYKETADLLYNYEKGGGTRECEVLATSEAAFPSASSRRANSANQWPPDDGDGHSTLFEQLPVNLYLCSFIGKDAQTTRKAKSAPIGVPVRNLCLFNSLSTFYDETAKIVHILDWVVLSPYINHLVRAPATIITCDFECADLSCLYRSGNWYRPRRKYIR
jgi:hypothetical protein